MSPLTAEWLTDAHHLYVHVPFCRLVCAYCDFVTVAGHAADIPRYVDALLAEMALRPAPGTLRTIYFGGGTPSLVAAADIARLVSATIARWGGSVPEEVTLEANPSARESADWIGLRDAGVNRLSLGVQSLSDRDLSALARGHTADEARAAYLDARDAGFANVSIDLIYGIPGQSQVAWRDGLQAALALAPDHISLYALQLALEPDEWAAAPRPGALRWRRRNAEEQDDELAARQYRLAEDVLADAGFEHYELSSWARPGRRSRHNAAYWTRRPYTGLGVGAHSYDGEAERSWNVRDIGAYLAGVEAGARPVDGVEVLDEPTRAFEAVALGLRRAEGVERSSFADEFGSDPVDRYGPAVDAGLRRGLLEVDASAIRLSRAGRLLANEALVEFTVPSAGARGSR